MKTNKPTINWDNYFTSYIHSSGPGWHRAQLEKYKKWYIPWLAYINKIVPIYKKHLEIFEIGSSIGAVVSLLHEYDILITGSDISKKAVSVAKRLNPNIPFIAYDIEKKIPGTKKYDRIIAFEVLEHLYDIPRSIRNIKKMLKRNGYFIGTSPYPYSKNMLDPTHMHVMFPEYWLKTFKKYGFNDVSVRPISCFPFLWKIHRLLNPVLPFYVPFKYFVSTILIIAKNNNTKSYEAG